MALTSSVLVVGSATPASAADCVTPYTTALRSVPKPPPSGTIISTTGGTLTVNTDVVRAYATAVANHFATATANFTTCAVNDVLDYTVTRAACVATSPGVMNAFGKNPQDRYVTLIGGIVQVHYATLLADADAVVDCFGLVLPDIS